MLITCTYVFILYRSNYQMGLWYGVFHWDRCTLRLSRSHGDRWGATDIATLSLKKMFLFSASLRAWQTLNPAHSEILFSRHASFVGPFFSLFALFLVKLSWQALVILIHAQTTLTWVSLPWLDSVSDCIVSDVVSVWDAKQFPKASHLTGLQFLQAGILPNNRLMERCRWMGSHFPDWVYYNGVVIFNRVARMGSHIFGILGVGIFRLVGNKMARFWLQDFDKCVNS